MKKLNLKDKTVNRLPEPMNQLGHFETRAGPNTEHEREISNRVDHGGRGEPRECSHAKTPRRKEKRKPHRKGACLRATHRQAESTEKNEGARYLSADPFDHVA